MIRESANKNAFEWAEGDLLVKDVPQGTAIVSAKIFQDQEDIRFMYREKVDNPTLYDTGWRIFSGTEDNEYCENPDHFSIFSLTRIANYQPEIKTLLWAPAGSVFEKPHSSPGFVPVTDWQLPEE